MHIDWWTLAFQTVNVLVLVWLLSRFLFKPVTKIMADRQQAAAALLEDASAARETAERNRKQAADALAALDAVRLERLGEISAEVERVRTSLLATARAEADALRTAAADDIETMKKNASRADAARATEFALEIAARLLARFPSHSLVEGFITPLADAVRALPDEDRSPLGRGTEPLHLIVSRPLSDDELKQCETALAAAAGRELRLQVKVDPNLIAGLELVAPHVVVRNSLRHDLDTLRADLLSHDEEHNA